MPEQPTSLKAIAAAVFLAGAASGGAAGRLSAGGDGTPPLVAPASDPLGGWRREARPRQVCLEGHLLSQDHVQATVRVAVVTRSEPPTLVRVDTLKADGAFWSCYGELVDAYKLDGYGASLCHREGEDLRGADGLPFVEATAEGRELARLEDFPKCVLEVFEGAVQARPVETTTEAMKIASAVKPEAAEEAAGARPSTP